MSEKLAGRLAGLQPEEQRLLLAQLLQEKGHKPKTAPLSFAQERLWFLDQLEPDSPLYNMFRAVQLVGRLDMAALKQSLSKVVRRHETLRATFTILGDHPIQVITPFLTLALPLVDLQGLAEDQCQAEARRLATAGAQQPFDLTQGPLFRVCLLRLGHEEHVLFLTMHHIVSDGWSLGVFVSEVAAFYAAFSTGATPSLPELSVQYTDFAVWQREWLQGQVLEKQIAYWKQHLSGAPSLLELPTDRPRPPVQGFRGTREQFALPKDLREALLALSHQEEATLFMTLLAAFEVLLHRYSRQSDLVVGTPIANRNQPGLESLIGFFVNTLVLRTDLSGNPTFRDLLRRVRKVAVGAYAHQDLPFEMLVEALQPERTLSHTPLFQVVFALQNTPMPSLELPGLTLNPWGTDTGTSQFDLILSVTETDQGMIETVEYNTDLFDAATIAHMMTQYQVLLNSIATNPDLRIADIPLLTEAERDKMVATWNDVGQYAGDQCIHELFEAQVKRTPSAIAVAFRNQQLSYTQLNTRANQLAHYLRRKGVGPDSVVAVMDDRTPEMIVALLGVLKAGGAYLPVDTQNPRDRILSLLDDSGASVVLTRTHIVEDIPFTWLQRLPDVSRDIVVTGLRPQIMSLDALPFPNRDLVDYDRYDQLIGDGYFKGSMSILATRGCPYQCLYCHKIWPKRHVVRSAQNIFDEVKLHYDRGYRVFKFLDDVFNLDRRNSEKFFELVIKNNLKIHLLFPSGLRGDILTPDYVDLASEAGTILIALALETASPRLQRALRKNLKIEKLRESLTYICEKHPHIILELFTMLGFPTETEEEALMTLDFVKGIKWLHFPYLNVLRIYPNTDMADFAMGHGITREAIERFSSLSFHELSDAMPFSKTFGREYQMRFMSEYFLLPERLKSVIPYQKRVLTREELVAKYDSYLPGGLESYPEVVHLIDDGDGFCSENATLREKSAARPSLLSSAREQAGDLTSNREPELRMLLLDLSQLFSREAEGKLYNLVEAPLGLMYLLTYLNQEFGDRVQGKILKSMVDFDSFAELKALISDFRPQIIGIRTLSVYKDFCHKTMALIKEWYPEIPIIAGGPYATSEYNTLLADPSVDLIVLGEGELTFAELVERILENDGKLPDDQTLTQIVGLAFVPRQRVASAEMRRGRQVLLLDKIVDEIGREDSGDPEKVGQVSDLAYVIYTSGSTGEPKGVMVPHRGLVQYVMDCRDRYGITSDDAVLQFASISFDTSAEEIYPCLLSGARLVLRDDTMLSSAGTFLQACAAKGITILDLPTAYWHLITVELAAGEAAFWPSLRLVIIGGEAALPERVELWRRHAPPHIRLANTYGPTETTIVATMHDLARENAPASIGKVPIGKPVANTQTLVLDPQLQPAPVGMPGELHIGGSRLARGYLHRPALTAERFIPNPFSAEPGARLYKTGDLVRYLPDGSIEFLGRVDHQVKLRGFRIELEEIETVLSQSPGVREAAVIVHGEQSGDKRLMAYLVARERQTLAVDEIRSFLRRKLPEYMIPSAFVVARSLPLTPGGKVDRRALLALGKDKPEFKGTFVAPRTPIEEALADIWADVLKLEQVGIRDNFFDMGGHSLLATQVVSRVRKTLEVELPVRVFFEAPTISEFGRRIEMIRWAAQGSQPEADSGYEEGHI
jgi:amino acid adenylation domain-containing protein